MTTATDESKDHNANPNPNQENQCIPVSTSMLTISIFQGSQPCRLVWEGHQQHVELQQLHQYFTKDYVKSSHPPLGGGIWTPDIYDHGSLSLLIHGLCIQAIYDPLPCALPGQLIIDRNLTPQTSPRYTLVTSLVKSQSWQIIW